MADILSLSRVRKARERAAKQVAAAENRTVYGRTKAEKDTAKAKQKLAAKALDAHKRET